MKNAKKPKEKVDTLYKALALFTADTMVLYVKTLNFHWNMTGPQFFMYHRLLEEQYKNLAEGLDELAERIRMLGGEAPGSMKDFLKLAQLKESAGTLSQNEMVKELVRSHTSMSHLCHQVIEISNQQRDEGTTDLLIERLRFHDQQAWLLRSHF